MEPSTTTDLLEIANALIFVAFTLGLAIGFLLTAARALRYRMRGEKSPELLGRDVIARFTLMLPFAGIVAIRLFVENARDEPWYPFWIVGSGTLAVIGVWVYVYYEAFVIER